MRASIIARTSTPLASCCMSCSRARHRAIPSFPSRSACNEGALTVAIHRLRKRFRELIRQEIAQMVGTETEAREEIGYLLSVM